MLSVNLKSHFEQNLVSLKTTKNFALFFLFQVTFSVFSSPRIYCIIKCWVPLKQFPSKNFHRKLSSFYIFVNFLRGNLFIKRIPSFAHWQHEKKTVDWTVERELLLLLRRRLRPDFHYIHQINFGPFATSW